MTIGNKRGRPRELDISGRGDNEGAPGENPKTFGDLLRHRLDHALPQQEEFSRKDLADFLGVKETRLVVKPEISRQKGFSRQEAVKIVQDYLTSKEHLRKPQETYTRFGLMANLRVKAPQLDQWAEEIGCERIKDQPIPIGEAMQIRGLVKLEEILASYRES